jgi:hypothetical protein
MESSTTVPDYFCELCSAQTVTFERLIDDQIIDTDYTYTDAAKHILFHEPCNHCEDGDSVPQVQLCDPCRHLRLQHLLLCSPSLRPKTAFQLPSSWEASDHCDLCRFWVAAGAHRGDESDSDGEAKHKLYVEERGTFALLTSGQSWSIRDDVRAETSEKDNRQWVREYIDGEWLRDWLRLSESGLSDDTKFSLTQDLQDLRVIDVSSHCVIHISCDSQYLALSYVWGSDSDDDLRCTKSNAITLSQAGILKEFGLPRTISDAIAVYQWLGYRFLWVDRLCIIQDDSTEALSKQLNQMADIYNRAALTLVAATGTSAAHGLAGVGYARDSMQVVCKYGKNFKLVTRTPSLEDLLPKSKRWTRGWAYQEYIASKRLLFFTDHGVYLKNDRRSGKILSEGFSWGSSWGSHSANKELDFALIEEYTHKELTYESDILRASSGILRAMYGNRTSYGMPWDDFDRAILWRPRTFDREPRESKNDGAYPTWSWTSSMGPVSVPEATQPIYSLAYWGRPTSVTTAPGSVPWSILAPKYAVSSTMGASYVRTYTDSYSESEAFWQEPEAQASEHYVVAGLSWLHGCIRTELPPWLTADCTRNEYAAGLKEQWLTSPSLYWQDAFQKYGEPFDTINETSSNIAGSIMVYTQMASFALDWRGQHQPKFRSPQPGLHPVLIRTNNHEIAGTCMLSERSAIRLRYLDQTHATFIALSTGNYGHDIIPEFVGEHFHHLSVSAFYGCPCSIEESDTRNIEHILECPEHEDFQSVKPTWSRNYWTSGDEDHFKLHDQAYSHHLARMSYHDINQDLLHSRKHPPVVWVMLIAPRFNDGTQLQVYERIAVGGIYLKRWVEFSPVFKALVIV